MKRLYTFVLYFALPWAFLRLWWRGFRQPGYRRHWRERLGHVSGFAGKAPVTWVHAVSVGEVRAAAPLVNALLQGDPQSSLLLTTTTPTGRDTALRLFGDRVHCCYLPWDLPFMLERFLSSVNPERTIVLETELWPNLFRLLKQRGIPLYLVNARLSDASLRGYRRVLPLARETLACVTGIAAQSGEDVRRFVALGASEDCVQQAGNLKYDARLPDDFDQHLTRLQQRFVNYGSMWVAGSTHPGEESMVLAVHRRLLLHAPDCLLWLAPRHPERAADVVLLCEQAGMSVALFSDPGSDKPQVIVIDVLGELVYLYGLASVAFVGGSLVPHGGHNPLEALQAGCTVVSGEHTDNFSDVYRQLEAAGAVTRVEDASSLAKAIETLLGDTELQQCQLAAGEQVLDRNRGALAQVLVMIEADAMS